MSRLGVRWIMDSGLLCAGWVTSVYTPVHVLKWTCDSGTLQGHGALTAWRSLVSVIAVLKVLPIKDSGRDPERWGL